MIGYVVAAVNVPPGRFAEAEAGSYDGAWFAARHLSKTHAGVSFGAYEVRPGEGSFLLASFLNGEQRFTAAAGEAQSRLGAPAAGKGSLPRSPGSGRDSRHDLSLSPSCRAAAKTQRREDGL